MIRVLEDAGGGRIRDAATKDLVPSREVVADYNEMRDHLTRITKAAMPFLERIYRDTQDTRDTKDSVTGKEAAR